MSTQPVTATSGRVAPLPVPGAVVSAARVTIVSAGLALGSAAAVAMLLWRPFPERDDFSYAGMAAVRDAAWAGFVVDAVGYAVAGVTLGLAVCLLTRGKGAGWANVGGVLTGLGSMLFAFGIYAFAVVGWYATEPAALPEPAGTAFMSYFGDHLGHLMGPMGAGFLAFNVGVLLLSVALWRSAAVPRWLPITIAALTIGQFVTPDALLDVEQALLMASFVAVAWFTFAARPRAAS
jgi:hypothetical protein